LEPQTPLPLLQPKPTPPADGSLGPAVAGAATPGAETDDVRSATLAAAAAEAASGVNPNPSGEGRGVVERLFRAGLDGGVVT